MNFNQLSYFLEICKYGSFSKAAQNIHVTQQALSKAISTLEEEIDLPLFYRSKSGVTLTKYGLFLFKHSEDIFNKLDFISLHLTQMHNYDLNVNTIKLSMAFGLAYFVPLDTFDTFKLKYPGNKILISEDNNIDSEKKVLNGSTDAAITIGPFDETKLNITPLASYTMLAIVNQHNDLALNKEIAFEELKGHSLISIKFKSQSYLVDQCKKAGFKPNIIFSSSDVISIYSLCSTNNCIGFGSEYILKNIPPHPSVRLIPIKDEMYKRNVCLITKKTNTKSKLLETLSVFLKKYARP